MTIARPLALWRLALVAASAVGLAAVIREVMR